jgi:hypothetical protein
MATLISTPSAACPASISARPMRPAAPVIAILVIVPNLLQNFYRGKSIKSADKLAVRSGQLAEKNKNSWLLTAN